MEAKNQLLCLYVSACPMPQQKIDRNQFVNQLHTILLLLAMAVVLALTGFLIFGTWGMIGALGLLAFGIFFSGRASAAVILRMYKASPISYQQAPQLVELFDELCRRAGLQTSPHLFYIPSRLPNAFAVGTGKSASVAVTDGLLRMMNSRELAGVLAHEIAHVINGDIRVMTTADAITRSTSMISRMGLFAMMFSFGGLILGSSTLNLLLGGLVMFFAPTLVIMLQLAVSRTREFNADLGSAELTNDPSGLASALAKLDRPKARGILGRILNPGMRRKEPSMLRTHPPTEQRVERLMELVKIAQERKGSESSERRQRIAIQDRPRVRQRPRYHITTGIWR